MALGDGRLMSGRSSLDEPTGSKKYSLAAPSSAEKAARRERKSNDLIDRNLQRAMRTGSPQQRIAAGKAYQERSSMPGYQQGGGIQSFEENQQRDRQTGDRFTAEGLRLAGEDPASVVEAQAGGVKKSNIGKSTADGGTGSNIGTAPADRSTATTTGALGDGSGSSAANAREALAEGSKGGDWVNVGDASTRPAETAPAAAPEAGKTDFAADRKLTLNANLARLKTKFEREDAAKKLAEQAESKGVDPKYQATEEQIQEGATLDFGKAYGDYLNGAGKTASEAEKKAKYAELKNKAAENGFAVTKDAKDKASWKSYYAKTNAAKTAGIDPDTITSETNFGNEAKALIPDAKKEIQSIIDQRENYKFSEIANDKQGIFNSFNRKMDEKYGDWAALNEDQKNKQRSEFAKKFGNKWEDEFTIDGVEDFNKKTTELKKLRGAPAMLDSQLQIVANAPSIFGQDDPVVASDRMFDGGESIWGNPSKPSPTKEVAPETEKKQASVLYGEDLFPADMPEEQRQYYRKQAGGSASFNTGIEMVLETLDGAGDDGDSKNWVNAKSKRYNDSLRQSLQKYGHSPTQSFINNKLQQETLKSLTASRDKTAGIVTMNSATL